MIADLLEFFDIDFQKAIVDKYKLKDGLYVKIGKETEYFIYKNRKNEQKEHCLKDLSGEIKEGEYKWFAIRDYISNYLNSNKAIDAPKKKIHNNNYLTLFVKAKEFVDENKEHFIDKLYENLKNFRNFNKKEEIKVLKDFEDYILDETRQKDIEAKKQKFLDIFDEIIKISKENEIKNYIKIFFDEPVKKYKDEAKIYFALKIFNKIETIIEIDEEIYGLSDFNMGLNQKKPYLEHKTRGFELPFMVKKEEIFRYKELFDFLKNLDNLIETEKNIFRPAIYLRKHSNNDQTEIVDFDIVSIKTNKLEKPFLFKNHLLAIDKNGYIEDEKITKVDSLFMTVDEIFYNGNLSKNLYNDVYSRLSNELQNLLYLTREAMINFSKKGEIEGFFYITKKYGDDFIRYHLRSNNEFKAKRALNLKLSILEYEGVGIMDIETKLEELNEKVQGSLREINGEDFYILSGQIIKYLLDKSKKNDKRADMIEPFLRAGKAGKLKQEIEGLYFKYKHEIPINFSKLNNAIALVMSYENDNEKVSMFKDKLFIGLLSENIFYRSSK
ncbi:hypothetical protein [Nitrosophilus alvini]|uniref:hypothetical protein n=1 Tax=Nitrosophilus alvini TaxID=2714855 RepID=UPI00190A19E5|nr:hypothetical protein [Nitrosophilus alvini]